MGKKVSVCRLDVACCCWTAAKFNTFDLCKWKDVGVYLHKQQDREIRSQVVTWHACVDALSCQVPNMYIELSTSDQINSRHMLIPDMNSLSDSLFSFFALHSFIVPLYHSLSLAQTHTYTQVMYFPPPFSLMISANERENISTVALNEKWQAIAAAAHSHRYIHANNKTQRLSFTTGDFGLLF